MVSEPFKFRAPCSKKHLPKNSTSHISLSDEPFTDYTCLSQYCLKVHHSLSKTNIITKTNIA